eukprot:TRINITY_DN21622_c0_g1_i1.p1 TRINITY_DN21622_c0_g1~~TRINITY_DN21622_c0_g1_i1.p1  ORF type:complete len:397 (+),score=91.40 TRINITY_DN21622_c0_g1_i1:60-1193(+)
MGVFDILVTPVMILIFHQTHKTDKLSFASSCKRAYDYVLKTKQILYQPQIVFPREKDYYDKSVVTHFIHLPDKWELQRYKNNEFLQHIKYIPALAEDVKILELINWSISNLNNLITFNYVTKLVYINITGYYTLNNSSHHIGTQCILPIKTVIQCFPNLVDLTCDYLEFDLKNYSNCPILPNIQHLSIVHLLEVSSMWETCSGLEYQATDKRILHLEKVFNTEVLESLEIRDPILEPNCLRNKEKVRIDSSWFSYPASQIWKDLKNFKKMKTLKFEAIIHPVVEDLVIFPELTHLEIGDLDWLETSPDEANFLKQHILLLQENARRINPTHELHISTYNRYFDIPTRKCLIDNQIIWNDLIHYKNIPIQIIDDRRYK